ncbi:MAG: phosphatase PAP2 family protein, partial [Nitrospirae bacterium]
MSREGNLLVPLALAVGYWSWWNWREAVWGIPCLGLGVGMSDFVGGQLKLWFARPRPCQVFLHLNELVGCGGTFSLPSNHALNTATAAAFLAVLYPMTGQVIHPVIG